MIRYILCVGILAFIWTINGREIIQAAKEDVASEIYIHAGLGIFLSLLILESTLGIFRFWARFDILWLKIVGFILFVPSAYLVWASHHILKHKGRPKNGKLSTTTTFVETGIYGIVRQPMTLGMAIWSTALVFVFQSIPSLAVGASAILCFWVSASKEGRHNIGKFGEDYREYMRNVPMWNVIIGLRRRREKRSRVCG
jgi:protein-S-isoprenylcysteine O-methyltransferase Ste14